MQPPPANARAHDEVQRPLRLPVLDRVLDDRLHEERRQADLPGLGGCVDRDLELRAEARLLQREVALDVAEFLGERDELLRARQRPAHVVGERDDQPPRAFGVGADEACDRVQAVEDEVRLHLRLHRRHLRPGELCELQLGGELVAQLRQELDVRLAQRRAVGRVRDERAQGRT